MDSILMTFAIPNGNPNATALAEHQAREGAAVHSLEAPSDPKGEDGNPPPSRLARPSSIPTGPQLTDAFRGAAYAI